jgi:hypothetical protein
VRRPLAALATHGASIVPDRSAAIGFQRGGDRMAEYKVEFDRDGKITIEDPEFIRRLTFVLHHDRRLLLCLAPRDPSAIDLTNPKCPPDLPDLLCPAPDSAQKLCPDPMDTSCPMLFRRPLEVLGRNEWVSEKAWKSLHDG